MIVKKIVESINSHGIHVWFDEWEINVGDSITSKIQDGLQESSLLVIILSTNSTCSPWVKKELNVVAQ